MGDRYGKLRDKSIRWRTWFEYILMCLRDLTGRIVVDRCTASAALCRGGGAIRYLPIAEHDGGTFEDLLFARDFVFQAICVDQFAREAI